jgi:hypothetical protein
MLAAVDASAHMLPSGSALPGDDDRSHRHRPSHEDHQRFHAASVATASDVARADVKRPPPRAATIKSKPALIGASLVGLVATTVGALVVAGMVSGADPQFERGRSPTSSVITQEVAGVLTLTALLAVLVRVPALARGQRVVSTLARLLLALLLGGAWLLTFAAERAS